MSKRKQDTVVKSGAYKDPSRASPATRAESRSRNLDEELEWWGNASVWSSVSTSRTLKEKDALPVNSKGPRISWFTNWKRDFLLGDDEKGHFGAFPALEKLHKKTVSLVPILSEIAQTRVLLEPSKALRRSMASRNERWGDAEKLRNGTAEERWQVLNKWAPILRHHTPSVKITIVQSCNNESEKFAIIQRWDVTQKKYKPDLVLPPRTRRIKYIQAKAYPDQQILKQIGQVDPDPEVLEWVAKRLLQIGAAKTHRPLEFEIYNCALKITELIKKQIGTPCNRETGELLHAAFPEYFSPKGDIANVTMKLIQRARVWKRTFQRARKSRKS